MPTRRRMLLSGLAALVIVGAAYAAGPGGRSDPDLSAYQTKSAAAAAQAAMQALVPIPCPATPTADTLMGSAGSMHCYVPQDAARPTVVQASNVTARTDGTWSVTWARPFTGASPIVLALPVNTGADPAVCNVSSRTATSAAGKCWAASGIKVSALGAIVNIFAAAPSLPLMVIAREPTQ